MFRFRVPDALSTPRQLLRLVNSISSLQDNGLHYLEEVFRAFSEALTLDLFADAALRDSHESFFAKAKVRLDELAEANSVSVHSFRRLSRHPNGVVVSTCHAVKGEEYVTVIAVSLLEGYIPNWRIIIDGTSEEAHDQATKLLYVISSRAKKRLHLVSERGRFTPKKREDEPCRVLQSVLSATIAK